MIIAERDEEGKGLKDTLKLKDEVKTCQRKTE